MSQSTGHDLPPEFQPLLDELASAPEEVRSFWRYAILLMMIDDEKARAVESYRDAEGLHLMVETIGGDVFSAVRPQISKETERVLLEHIREIVGEESKD